MSKSSSQKEPLMAAGDGDGDGDACIGLENLPRHICRRTTKKGFDFTIMVVGQSGLGKSTLIDTLFMSNLYSNSTGKSELLPPVEETADQEQTVKICVRTADVEERGVTLRLTVVDTPGFGASIDNTGSFKSVIGYLEDQYDKFLEGERGFNRKSVVDSRVHCCLYFVSPHGHGLKPLDVEFMRQVQDKVNIIPVIAKADILTEEELADLKATVMKELEKYKIKTYVMPQVDENDDDVYKEEDKSLKKAWPFAVCGSTTLVYNNGRSVRARSYPWGVVEIDNPEHCDFVKLKTMLVSHMEDLKEITADVHYEHYRSRKLSPEARASAGIGIGKTSLIPVNRTGLKRIDFNI